MVETAKENEQEKKAEEGKDEEMAKEEKADLIAPNHARRVSKMNNSAINIYQNPSNPVPKKKERKQSKYDNLNIEGQKHSSGE